MKFFKKAAILCLSLLTCATFGVGAISCADTPSNSGSTSNSESQIPAEPAEYTYRISVENAGGYAFPNVNVNLVKDGLIVATEQTVPTTGYAYFEDVTPDNYDIVIENYPTGYVMESTYKTAAVAGQEYTAIITPTGVLAGEPVANTRYKIGDIVHDFSVMTSDNKTFTLSSILAEKELVIVNFWATWCGPCIAEFPAMQNALVAYKDSVDCIAISTTDGQSAVQEFKNQYGHTFNMAASGAGKLQNYFPVGNIPQTYMIDRYGVVVFDHAGNMTATSDWTVRFDKFVGENYVPTVMKNKDDGIEDDSNNDTQELVKPNVPAPFIADVKTTLGVADDSFKFRFQEYGVKEGDDAYDEYNWPWIVTTEGNDTFLKASNQTVNNSYAILYADYTAKAGDVIAFDYKLGSEDDSDYLYLMVNGTPSVRLSGNHKDKWYTCYAYVFEEYEAGECELAFTFLKDSDKSVYEDVAYIRNLRVLAEKDIPSNAGTNAHVFRNAAHVLNEDENATTQYKYYDEVVYYSKEDGGDGYYHVGDVNGPILYANIWYASLWNETSAWMLTFNNYFVADGYNYYGAFEQHAWSSNQPTGFWGYTPVTKDLQELLDLMVKNVEVGQLWDGEYHDKEWLELCCYYQHYGDEPFRDTMAGITFHAAIDMQLGDNRVEVLYAINPRGFKYEFTPEQTGIYHVQSTSDSIDTFAFLFDENENMLGAWDNKIFVESWTDENGQLMMDGNFEFFWEFEAGTKYYLLFTTADDKAATYNVNISYEGATYTYFAPTATFRSQNLATYETFVADAPEYTYSDPAQGGDGYYHVVNKDGTLGSVIYLDTANSTYFFGYSLAGRINAFKEFDASGEWTGEWKVEPSKRPFYHNGVDYTELLDEYCFKAKQNDGDFDTEENGAPNGFIAVDQKLYEALIAVTESKEYDGEKNSWLLLCYYYVTIGG